MPVIPEQLYRTSPYLAELRQNHALWLAEVVGLSADASLQKALTVVREGGRTAVGETELSLVLREAKGRVALLAALAETGEQWTTEQSTAALSDLADAALEAGLDLLMRRAFETGKLEGSLVDATAASSGLALFALGKHGGRELNYSSDIDIVAFFDPERSPLRDRDEATKFYSRLVQRLVALMQDRVGGAYVFRTDLRLRPDPGSTPVAISVDAALAYYESRGQNWERAAWIKARPCAGDLAVGNAFLKELAPYVWRKHLDFATIADIQAMKRQINIAKNVGEARVAGHNVKLGQGGIREIEFFTQTQQLIAGGRDASLRVKPTAHALAALAKAGWINGQTAVELTETYWFLRAVENRLQMRRDEQTHIMPESADGIAEIAAMMGYQKVEQFEQSYRAALERVSAYYAQLFAGRETLGSSGGNLVFTGSEDDPGTLETLSGMGFADPVTVSTIVRKWHYGSYAATRTAAARAHLTELLPHLLETIAESGNADAAFLRFDNFLSRLPTGVQLFSLLHTHRRLRVLLVEILASAPRLAEAVIHRAHVMDGLIDPAFADEVSRPSALVAKVDSFLGEGRSYEDLIDRARIMGQEQRFLIAAALLSGTLTAERAGEQFTALAETLLKRLFHAVRAEFETKHGRSSGARVALLAFGKMASREMTFTSDLDFILLYDAPGTEDSDGPRGLAPSHYFTRLTQRLVAAVSAPTAEGVLYEADMRLRPSGNAGPLATPLSGFLAYHLESAWTWEHLALSRARVLFADADFGEEIEGVLARILSQPRDTGKTVEDVLSMRALMAKERPPRHSFDLKLATGGLVDLEFIAQSGQLVVGSLIGVPQAQTAIVLRRMGEIGLLPESERLVEAHALFSNVLEIMSAALLRPFKSESWTPAFRDVLARLTNSPDFSRLEADIAAREREVAAAAEEWYGRARTLETALSGKA